MTTDQQRLPLPSFDDVLRAQKRIAPFVHRTPVLTSRYLDELAGASLFFKCENFQKGGAFKARGATNAVFGLSQDLAAKGVATHSSGNHGTALSYAAGCRDIPATVIMPESAPKAKKAAVRGYGARIVLCEATMTAREAALAAVVEESGAHFIHPYNDPRIIAGQATCSCELLDEAGPFDAIIAPIGGGGMVSGTCLALSELSPQTRIYAAEPRNADDAFRSLQAGYIIADDAPQTIADGLRVPLGDLTWHFVSKYVTDILCVTEDEIIKAMALLWQRMKIVVEASSATALAAILSHRDHFAGQRVGVILTGGNVDLDNLPWLRHH